MKIALTILLSLALVTNASAPPQPPESITAVQVVLSIVVVAIAGVAIYTIIKCSRHLNKPPVIEGSTNKVHWFTKGQMQRQLDTEEFQFTEPATNNVMFYRAVIQ